jgi:hypothetical protein
MGIESTNVRASVDYLGYGLSTWLTVMTTRHQLNMFDPSDEPLDSKSPRSTDGVVGSTYGMYLTSIQVLKLSIRPYNALRHQGLTTLGHAAAVLQEYHKQGTTSVRNLGHKGLAELA